MNFTNPFQEGENSSNESNSEQNEDVHDIGVAVSTDEPADRRRNNGSAIPPQQNGQTTSQGLSSRTPSQHRLNTARNWSRHAGRGHDRRESLPLVNPFDSPNDPNIIGRPRSSTEVFNRDPQETQPPPVPHAPQSWTGLRRRSSVVDPLSQGQTTRSGTPPIPPSRTTALATPMAPESSSTETRRTPVVPGLPSPIEEKADPFAHMRDDDATTIEQRRASQPRPAQPPRVMFNIDVSAEQNTTGLSTNPTSSRRQSRVTFHPDVTSSEHLAEPRRASIAAPRRSSLFGERRGSATQSPFRRPSLFNWNLTPRRESNVDPLDAMRRSSSTPHLGETTVDAEHTLPPDGTDVAIPPQAHTRSKSFAAEPRFTHPFQTQEGQPITLGSARRASMPVQRRPSTVQRLMSVTTNPVPQRYRSRSVSSVAYFVSPMKRNNSVNPIFEEDILSEKENVREFLEAADEVQRRHKRSRFQMELFRAIYLVFIIALVYFIFVGKPLWKGVGAVYYDFIRKSAARKFGSAAFIAWAGFQAFLPILGTRFEPEVDDVEQRDASETALIIPAYKAANVLPETIEAALKIFKAEQIYIIANGNNPTPLDHTADVCQKYGVNHAWVPIGSKITAEFVGVALTRRFRYIMLIDDDVHLPPNLPLVTNRLVGNTKCIGYTIKSTGPNGSRGTLINQCQDMEYKVAGLTRTFAGKYGSATFPHGAIILWERETLQNLFNVHPGYVISEDWYFGHCARASGYRIQFCSQVFVETETPPALFKSSSAARGGFGEMTVYKQRFYRWNYFFAYRLYDDGAYMLLSWRLGWREFVTKIFVLVELYDSVMAIIRPFAVVLTLIGDAKLFFALMGALMVMYSGAFCLFNTWHLRKKNEMVAWKILPVYMGMKFILLWATSLSVYRAIFHYAAYFMKKHPRLIESRAALEAAYNVRLGTALVPLDSESEKSTATLDSTDKELGTLMEEKEA